MLHAKLFFYWQVQFYDVINFLRVFWLFLQIKGKNDKISIKWTLCQLKQHQEGPDPLKKTAGSKLLISQWMLPAFLHLFPPFQPFFLSGHIAVIYTLCRNVFLPPECCKWEGSSRNSGSIKHSFPFNYPLLSLWITRGAYSALNWVHLLINGRILS